MVSAATMEITTESENTNTVRTAGRIRRIGRYRRLYSTCIAFATLCRFAPTAPRCRAFAPSRKASFANVATEKDDLHRPYQYSFAAPPLRATQQQQPKSSRGGEKKKKRSKPKYNTIGDVMRAVERNPNEFVVANSDGDGREWNANGRRVDAKKKPRRSRKRVERPKQKYLYASQRRALGSSAADDGGADATGGGGEGDGPSGAQGRQLSKQQRREQEREKFLHSLGLDPSTQAADAVVGDGPEEVPRVVASVRVDGESKADGGGSVTSNSFAYVMYKPAGWSILGDKKKGKNKKETREAEDAGVASATDAVAATQSNGKGGKGRTGTKRKVKAYDERTDEFSFVEYDEADVLAALTPEERAELTREGGLRLDDGSADAARGAVAATEWDDHENTPPDDGASRKRRKPKSASPAAPAAPAAATAAVGEAPPRTAILRPSARPSLVGWLKERRAAEGAPIRGGNRWAALAGAVDVDDSGLVLLCPRDRTDAVYVDQCGYVAVVGGDGRQASGPKPADGGRDDGPVARVEVRSRLRRGRDRDPVLTVGVAYGPEGGASATTCARVASLLRDRFGDGVRGDAAADPLDRRAARRLVHCESMSVSSLANLDDDPVAVGPDDCPPPDDVACYEGRGEGPPFAGGSFLGRRSGLARNGATNAYREINGAADGYPGWIVDRYDEWLFVQHRRDEYGADGAGGPLPSLHDGRTAGVYYLPAGVDRSVMGTSAEALKPELIEGRPAPPIVPVSENGVTYHVRLGESFSTGVFLDQRLQRAWLAGRCEEGTRVLNCFAHAGAFSVAAATAGAKTVSLDLDRKWLDRIRPQMEANGVTEWEGRHDCIYGDCFDWLARLAKRGEKFDIVILDPPSTSVGKKKRRWSVQKDTAELVSLAAPLVAAGGLLFATTNSASLTPEKFAGMCRRGLDDAGASGARLERVSPMPSDFPSVGTQPVKNLVWRLP